MKPIARFAAACLLAGPVLTLSAQAQESPKIVTISFNAAVLNTDEAKAALTSAEAKLNPRQTALKALNTEVGTLSKELQAKPSTLSETERTTREHTLAEKQRKLQRDAQELQSDVQSEEQRIFQQVAQKFYPFLQSYGSQHGYTLIVERGSDSAPVVWYTAPQVDITADVVKAYNAAPPQAAPAAQKPAAAPATAPH